MKSILTITLVMLAFNTLLPPCGKPSYTHSPLVEISHPAPAYTVIDDMADIQRLYDDSIRQTFDSMMKIHIAIPPLFSKVSHDSATTVRFFELASKTNGEIKMLTDTRKISEAISDIIGEHSEDGADIMLVIDKTGSMQDDIVNVKFGSRRIIDSLRAYDNINLAIAFYGDKNYDGDNWLTFEYLGQQYERAKKIIDSLEIGRGGDIPESVYDAVILSVDHMLWREGSKKIVILIGDAPPLEKPKSDYTISDVIAMVNKKDLNINFYPIVVSIPQETIDEAEEAPEFVKEKIITRLYPNPCTGPLTVEFNAEGEYTIEVFNSSGALVYDTKFVGKTWTHECNDLENGVYLLRAVNGAKQFETVKFIKQGE